MRVGGISTFRLKTVVYFSRHFSRHNEENNTITMQNTPFQIVRDNFLFYTTKRNAHLEKKISWGGVACELTKLWVGKKRLNKGSLITADLCLCNTGRLRHYI